MLEARDIIFRTVEVWLFGILVISVLTGYAARHPKPHPVSVWIMIPVFIARITTIGSGVGIAVLVAKAIIPHAPLLGVLSLIIATFLSLWVTFTVTQVAQNIARRLLGVSAPPMRQARNRPPT